MGLDNGITLTTRRKIKEEDIPEYVTIELLQDNDFETDNGYIYDVTYWRKCWNIRGMILELDIHFNEDEYSYDLTPGNIEKIQDWFCSVLKGDVEWDEEQTIWEYKYMVRHIAQDIVNLGWLKEYMQTHKCKVEFYDSY